MTPMPTRLTAAALLFTALCAGAQTVVPPKAQLCVSCHGPEGRSPIPAIPNLAGQTSRYLYLQMRDFQEGRRSNPMMSPMVTGLTRDEMREIGEYFAAATPAPRTFTPDPAKAKLGQAKAEETLCTMCHLGGFLGQNEVPRVAGQHFDYIVAQLKAFKAHARTNDAGTMTSVAGTLSDQDIENLAHYVAGL